MDITKLIWTKNVTPLYPAKKNDWAYRLEKSTFKLHWRNKDNQDKNNAGKPEEGDIILLRQRGKVTHLVKLRDNDCNLEESELKTEFNIYRHVEIIWITDDWDNAPSLDQVFVSKIKFPRGGKVCRIENLKAYKERWEKQGLAKFQQQVIEQLKI